MDHGDNAAAAADAALTTLATSLLPILEGFHRRHRNQHGTSHWWSAFQLVRRGARSLAADLRQPPPPPPAAASKSKSKTTEKRRQQRLRARVDLLRNQTIPKAYLCFSQLIADNQYAALGLLLLSVLASMTSILTSISSHNPREPHPNSTTHHTPVPDTTGPTDSTSRPRVGQNVDTDKGVAVSRDSVPGSRLASSKPQPMTSTAEDAAPTSKKKKRRVLGGSEAELKKKKKKSKKGGDELSSLFGSL